jgi:hypothetical protein
MHIGFRWRNLRVGDHFRDPSINEKIYENDFSRSEVGAWTGLTWLRIGTGGGL